MSYVKMKCRKSKRTPHPTQDAACRSSDADSEGPAPQSPTADVNQSSALDASMETRKSCDPDVCSDEPGIRVMPTGNKAGQRKWDKKHFCFYCDEPQAKLPRHLQSCHNEEKEVLEVASTTDHSARKRLLMKIRNLGNHMNNCRVLREGKGVLLVAYRPTHEKDPQLYGPCIHCYGYYIRRDLWRHECPLKPALVARTDGSRSGVARVRGRVAHKSDLLKPPPPGVSFRLNRVLSPMKKDGVGLLVKSDFLILELAKREYLKMGHDVDQHGYIRNKLREMGRLVIQLRTNTHRPNSGLESFMHPCNFSDIVKAVLDVAGFSEDEQLYRVPSLALKLGHSIKKCAQILKGNALECGNKNRADEAEEFLQLCDMKWGEQVSTHAHRTLYQGKRNKSTVLPTNADVVKMSTFLRETSNRELQHLQRARDQRIAPAWKRLNELALCHLIMFNRRRQGEVSKMKVDDFHKRRAGTDSGDCLLTDLERHLCKMFHVIEVVGKRGRTVPVLVSSEAMEWLNALVAMRHRAGVAPDNTYFFACCSFGGNGHIRGSDCLRTYAHAAGLDNADSIRSTKLRKHVATASQILALTEHQLETLADFMGHDLRVHREYYQLPDTVQRVTKLSRLFLSLERGALASQQGRSLDELDVTGGFTSDEDSTESGECCDSSDGEVTFNRRQPASTPPPSLQGTPKPRVKRRPWTVEEKQDVMEGLHRFLLMKKVPGKRDIETSCTVALQTRTWKNIKDFCRNRMKL